MWCHFTWSSANSAITIDEEKDQPTIAANGTGHVTPLAVDSTGKVTATIIFNKAEDEESPITITKDFTSRSRAARASQWIRSRPPSTSIRWIS
ncbi:MAG: hypothetical protein ACLUFI_14405 [Oscillospiraceae bacterium]